MLRRVGLTAAVALAGFGVAAPGAFAHGVVASRVGGIHLLRIGYDSIPSPLPGNLPSEGVEAYAFNEFGNEITLAGTQYLRVRWATVTMSSWACQAGNWSTAGSCVTTPGAKFSEPVTLNIYNPPAQGTDTPGSLIESLTQTFLIPYRPSSNPAKCPDGQSWYDWRAKVCNHGLATDITFALDPRIKLPGTIVYGIAYNSTHYGPSPYGQGTACYGTTAGCPYDSLNIALSEDPADVSAGSDPNPGTVWQLSPQAGEYCDSGTAGVGVFRLDSPGSACWSVNGDGKAPYYVPAVRFSLFQPLGDLPWWLRP